MFRDFFSMDSPFVRLMAKVADFMILNLLFVICSLPIVTMGAAVTAMYDVLTRMDTRREVPAATGFMKAFNGNFKKATKLWLIFLAVAAFLVFDIYLMLTKVPAALTMQVTLIIVFLVILFVWIMAVGYAFVLLARLENPLGRTIKMSFALTLVHLIPNSIFTGIVSLLPIIILFGFTQLFFAFFPVWIFGGIPLLAYVNSKIYMRIIVKYVPELKDEKEELKPLDLREELTTVSDDEVEEENHG